MERDPVRNRSRNKCAAIYALAEAALCVPDKQSANRPHIWLFVRTSGEYLVQGCGAEGLAQPTDGLLSENLSP
jgi:hypothetical protein